MLLDLWLIMHCLSSFLVVTVDAFRFLGHAHILYQTTRVELKSNTLFKQSCEAQITSLPRGDHTDTHIDKHTNVRTKVISA